MARPDTFTEEEKSWLKENYSTAPWETILSTINNKTKVQIISKASKMNLLRTNSECSLFNKNEDDIIRKYYSQIGAKGIANRYLSHRSVASISSRAYLIGVHKKGFWTEEEDEIIITNYYEMPMSELVKLLPTRTKSAVHCRIKQLGLSGAPMYKYTEEDIAFVKENYESMSDKELGEVLHRAPASIKEMRRKNQLYRKDPNRTLMYRYLGDFVHRHDVEWKKASAKQCGYRCFITGEAFDVIHHMYSRNMIIRDVCNKYNIPSDWNINIAAQSERDRFIELYSEEASKHPLGICLVERIHRRFHSIYGYGDNTVEQFKEFIQNFYPEKLCNLNELVS